MFRITAGKGFQITFANEYMVSVQFGGRNYCENRMDDVSHEGWAASGAKGCVNAECAV